MGENPLSFLICKVIIPTLEKVIILNSREVLSLLRIKTVFVKLDGPGVNFTYQWASIHECTLTLPNYILPNFGNFLNVDYKDLYLV